MIKASTIIKAVAETWYQGDIRTYIFTTEGTDADLDGMPARIFQVDKFGEYEMHYIDGSRMMAKPEEVRMLD
jgi:hypothetical protein